MDIDQATLNDQTAATQETAAPSMAESMAATLAGIRERETASSGDGGEAAAKVERARAPDGKFTKVDDATAAAAPVEQAVTTQQQPATQEAAATQAPATTQQAFQPPSSWTAAAKAEFAKASPVIQQEVLRREQQMHDGIAQYKEKATYADTLQKAIAPFENTIRGMGVTPDVAISALLSADHQLRYGSPQEKMNSFLNIAKSYGIDLSQGIPEQQQLDPNIQYLQTELQSTKQQLNQFLTAQQQREQMELNSQIERAKQGKEHFDAVRNEMAALLQAGSAKDIDEAYDMAVYARPDLRQALLAKQLEEKLAAENQRRAEEAKKADEAAKAAKAAAAPNVARRGTLPAQRSPGSMRDTMLETLEQIRSR
jgi:hypothetical protein